VSGHSNASDNEKKKKIKYPVAKIAQELHTQSVDPLTHGAYAITWFGLAVSGLVMTYFKFRKNKRVLKIRIPNQPNQTNVKK
jgi:cytochrome oxidase assembly protein ShyY1